MVSQELILLNSNFSEIVWKVVMRNKGQPGHNRTYITNNDMYKKCGSATQLRVRLYMGPGKKCTHWQLVYCVHTTRFTLYCVCNVYLNHEQLNLNCKCRNSYHHYTTSSQTQLSIFNLTHMTLSKVLRTVFYQV